MNVPTTSTLREGLAVIGRGIKDQPRWFALAVLGSAVYGVMTSLTAAAIGFVVNEPSPRRSRPGMSTAAQLWFIGGCHGRPSC